MNWRWWNNWIICTVANKSEIFQFKKSFSTVAYQGGGGCSNPPEIRKALQNRAKLNAIWKLLKIAEFQTPTPQEVRKKGSKIPKLQPVCNYFTLAMTNKLDVIINSLKVPKIKKILQYEMKFLVPNYSFLLNPWLVGYCPQISVLSVLNWISWTPSPEQNSWVLHWFSRNV